MSRWTGGGHFICEKDNFKKTYTYCRNRSEMSMSEAESCDPPERYVHVASSATSSNLSIRMAETERLHAHSYVW